MNLYELTNIAQELYENLQNEEVENKDEIIANTLEGLEADEAVEYCCKLIQQFSADTDTLKNEKMRLQKKQQTAENNVKRLKQNLLNFINASGQKKLKAGIFTVSKSTSQAVNITDISAVPPCFLQYEPKADKKAIKEFIKNGGGEVDGAELITNESVRVS